MKTYQHTQFGWVTALTNAVIGLVILLNGAFAPHPAYLLWVGVGILLLGAFFSTLTISIENGLLRASFGPGLIQKKVRVAEIASVRPIPVRWWYGCGIRLTPRGWLYNVSGWDAVEITLRDGRHFCLGTDEPENLRRAIEQASV